MKYQTFFKDALPSYEHTYKLQCFKSCVPYKAWFGIFLFLKFFLLQKLQVAYKHFYIRFVNFKRIKTAMTLST